jgi:kynurenine formamidase
MSGLRTLGIEHAGSWIAQGICLDIAAAVGVEHLEEPCRRQDIAVSAGDVVFLHTGWARFYEADGDRYLDAEPGAGWDAAHWLTDRRVSLVGADNWGFEAVPPSRGASDRTAAFISTY